VPNGLAVYRSREKRAREATIREVLGDLDPDPHSFSIAKRSNSDPCHCGCVRVAVEAGSGVHGIAVAARFRSETIHNERTFSAPVLRRT